MNHQVTHAKFSRDSSLIYGLSKLNDIHVWNSTCPQLPHPTCGLDLAAGNPTSNCHSCLSPGPTPYLHPVVCDGCGITPVIGMRFRCNSCPNFDFCSRCRVEKPHDPLHQFQEIHRSVFICSRAKSTGHDFEICGKCFHNSWNQRNVASMHHTVDSAVDQKITSIDLSASNEQLLLFRERRIEGRSTVAVNACMSLNSANGSLTTVSFSPNNDNTWQVSLDDDNPAGKDEVLAPHPHKYSLSSSHELVALYQGKDIKIIDTRSSKCLQVIGSAHSEQISSVRFSKDCSLLSSTCIDGTVKLWHVRPTPVTVTVQGKTNQAGLLKVVASADGYRVGSLNADQTINIYSTDTGICEASITESGSVIGSGFSSVNSDLFWTVCVPKENKIKYFDFTLWDAKSGKLLFTGGRLPCQFDYSFSGQVIVSFSSDNRFVGLVMDSGMINDCALGVTKVVVVWDISKSTPSQSKYVICISYNYDTTYNAPEPILAFSPCSNYLVVAVPQCDVQLVDLRRAGDNGDCKQYRVNSAVMPEARGNQVYNHIAFLVCFSRDSKFFCIAAQMRNDYKSELFSIAENDTEGDLRIIKVHPDINVRDEAEKGMLDHIAGLFEGSFSVDRIRSVLRDESYDMDSSVEKLISSEIDSNSKLSGDVQRLKDFLGDAYTVDQIQCALSECVVVDDAITHLTENRVHPLAACEGNEEDMKAPLWKLMVDDDREFIFAYSEGHVDDKHQTGDVTVLGWRFTDYSKLAVRIRYSRDDRDDSSAPFALISRLSKCRSLLMGRIMLNYYVWSLIPSGGVPKIVTRVEVNPERLPFLIFDNCMKSKLYDWVVDAASCNVKIVSNGSAHHAATSEQDELPFYLPEVTPFYYMDNFWGHQTRDEMRGRTSVSKVKRIGFDKEFIFTKEGAMHILQLVLPERRDHLCFPSIVKEWRKSN
jgi:WD40 repeat protein